ncbi:hypothetical protein ACFFGH_00355 [Lysobacter korlensis]|uniref:Secreted protein n=1 Tax=Lysobacter korlensis TaxID=553636 RepID=A0ABV6RIA9_9GAMM
MSSRLTSLAIALLCFASTSATGRENQVLPADFPDRADLETFPIALSLSAVNRRITKSGCGTANDDMSALGLSSGLLTRPSGGDGLYVDKGRLADGARWYAMRNTSEPDILYCGIVVSKADQGTQVSFVGVPQRNFQSAVAAVEAGNFFCKCKQLSR